MVSPILTLKSDYGFRLGKRRRLSNTLKTRLMDVKTWRQRSENFTPSETINVDRVSL